MAVVRIDVLCQCEGCGKRFGVELERSDQLDDICSSIRLGDQWPDLGDMVESLVREEICAGNGTYYTWGVRGKATVDRIGLSHRPTIQANMVLCDVCSKKCDELPIEGALTLAQVQEALGINDV
jgi:hypothetical protein